MVKETSNRKGVTLPLKMGDKRDHGRAGTILMHFPEQKTHKPQTLFSSWKQDWDGSADIPPGRALWEHDSAILSVIILNKAINVSPEEFGIQEDFYCHYKCYHVSLGLQIMYISTACLNEMLEELYSGFLMFYKNMN